MSSHETAVIASHRHGILIIIIIIHRFVGVRWEHTRRAQARHDTHTKQNQMLTKGRPPGAVRAV